MIVVLRGHEFLPVYLNPKFMNDARWDALAGLLKWARGNADTLRQTVPLLPASWQHGGLSIPNFNGAAPMPREPYGYAHVKNGRGLVALRNPWIAPQSYRVKLDEYLGFSPADAMNLSAVSLYPEPRLYGENLKFGDTLEVALAPYETVVLSIGPPAGTQSIPRASDAVRNQLAVLNCEHELRRTAGAKGAAARLTCRARVRVTAPWAELLVLCEGQKPPTVPPGRLTIGGRAVPMETISSAAGWFSGPPSHEHWTFLRAPLSAGESEIVLDQAVGQDCTKLSVWLWATKPGGAATYPNALPQPETISLDGAVLMNVVELK